MALPEANRWRSSGGGERTGGGPARDAAANPCQQACLVWGWAGVAVLHPARTASPSGQRYPRWITASCKSKRAASTTRWRVVTSECTSFWMARWWYGLGLPKWPGGNPVVCRRRKPGCAAELGRWVTRGELRQETSGGGQEESERPLSRFPLSGGRRGGRVPSCSRHAARQPKTPACIMRAAPPARGLPPPLCMPRRLPAPMQFTSQTGHFTC